MSQGSQRCAAGPKVMVSVLKITVTFPSCLTLQPRIASHYMMSERTDEESSLVGEPQKTYGVHSSSGQPSASVRRSWRQTPSGYSSRAGSDNEDYEPSIHTPRHRRPPLSTLSSFMNARHSDTPNLVLPALDPR